MCIDLQNLSVSGHIYTSAMHLTLMDKWVLFLYNVLGNSRGLLFLEAAYENDELATTDCMVAILLSNFKEQFSSVYRKL